MTGLTGGDISKLLNMLTGATTPKPGLTEPSLANFFCSAQNAAPDVQLSANQM
jgi:hypothetical protein